MLCERQNQDVIPSQLYNILLICMCTLLKQSICYFARVNLLPGSLTGRQIFSRTSISLFVSSSYLDTTASCSNDTTCRTDCAKYLGYGLTPIAITLIILRFNISTSENICSLSEGVPRVIRTMMSCASSRS